MQQWLTYIGFTAKYVVSGIAASCLFANNSQMPIYYIIGAIASGIQGEILKNVIRQPRPSLSPKKGFGMPSSHTNAIAYFSFVLLHTSPQFLPEKAWMYKLLLATGVAGYSISAW